jgi:hypothetical protein
VYARKFLLLSYCVPIILAGASSGSTDLDIVVTASNALQPKIQEIYQTPQVDETALHVNNDDRFRGKKKFSMLQKVSTKDILVTEIISLCIICKNYEDAVDHLLLHCGLVLCILLDPCVLGW